MTIRNTLTLAALLLTTAVTQAQVPTTPATPGTATPNTATTYTPYRAKQVLGTTVSLAGGDKVGTVDDIVFDQEGQIEYLIVANDNRLVTVPWQAAKFDVNAKTAQVTMTTEKYRTVPSYDATTYPEYYTPAYRAEIYRYYGLTPRELRRPLLPRRR